LIATLTITQSFPEKKELLAAYLRSFSAGKTTVSFPPSAPFGPPSSTRGKQCKYSRARTKEPKNKKKRKKKINNLDCFSFCYYVLLPDKNPPSVAPSIAEFCASKTGCSSLVPVSVTLKIGLVSREVTAATGT
jgi:hypothetical protein